MPPYSPTVTAVKIVSSAAAWKGPATVSPPPLKHATMLVLTSKGRTIADQTKKSWFQLGELVPVEKDSAKLLIFATEICRLLNGKKHRCVKSGVARVEKGMRPTMARLTLARKMAAISLTVWKKGVEFDPQQLQRQAA
jgi:hypothetical protein